MATSTRNSWEPVYGDEIGPTRAQRTRSAVVLLVVLTVLGIAFAAGLGVVALILLTLVGASAG